jgi:hypothetical protein
MHTGNCLESQIFWAAILWSWCGPQVSDAVVRKDARGFIVLDQNGEPIPATLKDLRELVGLAMGMKGAVTRAVQCLLESGSIRFENKSPYRVGVMYPEREPASPFSRESEAEQVASTGNLPGPWNIAGLPVLATCLPSDPVAKTEVIQWLDDLSTAWKSDLRELKTRNRELLRQGLSERGIIIGISLNRRLEEEAAAANSVPVSEDPEPEEETPPPSSRQYSEIEAAAAVLPGWVHALSEKFAGKPVPTSSQARKAAEKLESCNLSPAGFLAFLTPERMESVRHPGILAELVESYRASVAAEAKEPPGCPYCQCPRQRDGKCAACGRTPEMARVAAEQRAKNSGQRTAGSEG